MRLSKAQLELVSNLKEDFHNGQNAIVGWYTGSGKTTVINKLIKELLEVNPKLKIGFSAHFYVSLKEQVTKVLGKSHKVSNDPFSDANVVVFNPQSVYKKDVAFDLLVIDEAHEGLSTDTVMLRAIMEKSKVVFALTATSWELSKDFPQYKVYKRGLIEGIDDGRVGEFKYKLHEYEGRIEHEDVDGNGEVRAKYLIKNRDLIIQFQKEKLSKLSATGELGDKVLVIVPSSEFSYPLHEKTRKSLILDQHSENEEEILESFRKDPNIRYLIVVRKCGVGFDMPELTDVVDLTMTRNLKQIVQRMGRVTRKHHVDKRYHYVYDARMTIKNATFYMDYAMDLANCEDYELPKNRKQTVVLGNDGKYSSEMSFSEYILKKSTLKNVATVSIEDYKKTGESKEDILDWLATKEWVKDKDWKDAIKDGDIEAKRKRKRATVIGELTNINKEYFLSDEMLLRRLQVAKDNKPNGFIKEMGRIDWEGAKECKNRGLYGEKKVADINLPREDVMKIGLSYENNTLFKAGRPQVHQRARNLGMLEDIKNARISRDKVSSVMSKYSNQQDFEKFQPTIAKLAKEMGLTLQDKQMYKGEVVRTRLNYQEMLGAVKRLRNKSDVTRDIRRAVYDIRYHLKKRGGKISKLRLDLLEAYEKLK